MTYTVCVDGIAREATPEEVAQIETDKSQRPQHLAQTIRLERNARLAACDWTQGKDIADNISAAWAAYRQALRDIPAQPGFPADVVWPAQPE